jgi:hypothetical protein
MHIGCCPHVYLRLLVYLWTAYQKLTIVIRCVFSSYIAFSAGVLFYTTFYRLVLLFGTCI